MTALAEIVLHAAAYGRVTPEKQVSRFTPEQIRQTIAYLVSRDQLALANALVDAGLSLHPHSQDILCIGALVAEVQQDWERAKDLLQELMKVQKGESPPDTWLHWIRVLRCRGEIKRATQAAKQAAGLFPEHPQLQVEKRQLLDMTQDTSQLETPAISH